MRTTKAYQIGKYVLWGILGVAAIAGFGFVVMWLWNWLIPEIFGLGEITFWQAFGIIIMARLLFTGLRMYPPHPHRSRFKGFNGHISDHKRAFFVKDGDFKFSPRNWRHYKEFWEEKGKAAYEEYVKKAEEKSQQK